MRRVTGLMAGGLGAFLVVLALLIRFVVVGEAVKFRLNENSITTQIAANASYFSPSQLKVVSGVTLEDTLTVQGDNAAGNSSRAVWNEFSYVYDKTNHAPVAYSTNRLAFDRRTGVLINCCGTAIGTNTNPHVSGQGYVWPFNAQKQTYLVYNTTLLKTVPATYAGTVTVDGLTTYKYVENIVATRAGTQTLPGSLVGQQGTGLVTLREYFRGTTTEYVNPTTGIPVEEVSDQHLYLADNSGRQVLSVLNAAFATTSSGVAAAVKTVKKEQDEIKLLSVFLPAAGGLAGIILLIAGVFLTLSRRPEVAYDDAGDEYARGEVPA
jgi:Porin PorA